MDSDGVIVIDTPEGIEAFRLLSIKGRLKLELMGLKFKRGAHGSSTFAYVKRTWGFKGNNQKVYEQYVKMLEDNGILKPGYPEQLSQEQAMAKYKIEFYFDSAEAAYEI